MKTWLQGVLFLVLLFGVIQVIHPNTTNPPIQSAQTLGSALAVDSNVATLLERSCHDCHSNNTRWPWYSQVAPVSWLVVGDVNRGRRAMNLSEWTRVDATKQRNLLTHICGEVKDGEMPPQAYKVVHRNAGLTSADTNMLCAWTNSTVELQRRADKEGD
ncbi:MAG TPA: heme-binding domain-containing protein [Terriglobales bacterium]